MTQEKIDLYVQHALAMHGYTLDQAANDAVCVEFQRIHAIAQSFVGLDMPVSLESAEVFLP
jgi:hypothetical protein